MSARRVLVIEDEAGARDALGSLLSDEGYLVRTAPSGRVGLEYFREFAPDTVVCDYLLPDIDGLQVLREIRAASSQVTFIMLTAGCAGAEAEPALRAEADYFLGKPVNLSEFRSALQDGRQAPNRPRPQRPYNRKDRAHGRT